MLAVGGKGDAEHWRQVRKSLQKTVGSIAVIFVLAAIIVAVLRG